MPKTRYLHHGLLRDVAANYGDTHVKRLWDSIKKEFRHREYLKHPEGLYGIGTLFK